MKMELRDSTPERLGLKPNIDLRITQLVTVSFDQSVSQYTRVKDGSYVTDGYESNGLFEEKPGITEWNVSRHFGSEIKPETGFLRGFPIFKNKYKDNEERGIELFFDYTDIYGSSLVVSLKSLRTMYLHSNAESTLEALKHDTEVDRNVNLFTASILYKGSPRLDNEINLSYELLDAFIAEAAKLPKQKVFDYEIDKLDGAYVVDSATGLMVVRQKQTR